MATLFNTKISQTYQGLFKTIDNAILTAAFKELTDGSGNQSGLFLNTAGDFKVTAILEWGSLKDSGTGVTITQFVTAANGIGNFNNDTTLPTSAAVKLYVDTKFSQTDTLTEVLGFGNTTSGKDIAVSAGDDITFTDTSKAIFGAGSDLQIYHDGSNSFIEDAGTGSLRVSSNSFRIYNVNKSEFLATFNAGGAVDLYYNNIKRFETTTDGSKVTGNLVVTGTITGAGGSFLPLAGGTMTGNIILNDNVKSIYGTASDGLEIYHDSSNSYIKDNGTGFLNIQSDAALVLANGSGEPYFIGTSNGSVKLYYDNSSKLETTTSGVSITGGWSTTALNTVGSSSLIKFIDNAKALFGTGNDLQIYHDGSNSYIDETGTGDLRIKSTLFRVQSSTGEAMINASQNGIVQLYENNVERFRTVSDGAKVTGNLEVTGTISGSGGSFLPLIGGTMTGNTIHNDNVKSIYGTASDGLEIFHNGTHSNIRDTGTGNLYISASEEVLIGSGDLSETYAQFNDNGAVRLRHDNSIKFATTSTGISVTGNVVGTGDFRLSDNKQLQFGANPDLILFHNATDSFIRNNTGALNIEQAAATESIVFKTSNNFALDTTALTISRNGDMLTGRNVTIAGDLTVNGTTTTVNSQTLSVVDPLIQLAKANTANSLDIGFYGDYNDGTGRFLGLFSDASDSNKFRLFKGTTVEPTTTVNIAGAGYVAADLVVAGLEATTGTFAGNITATTSNATISASESGGATTRIMGASVGRVGTSSNHNLEIQTNNQTAITIDTSQNASFAGDISLLDNKRLYLGTGNDFEAYHDGSNTYLRNLNGNFIIKQDKVDADLIFQCDDGAGGVATYFTLDGADGIVKFNKNIKLQDSVFLNIGSNNDLQLYHNATDSFISNGQGDLTIQNIADDKDIIFKSDNGSGGVENYIQIDGSEGRTTFNKDIRLNDNIKAGFGGSADLQIFHDGGNSYISDVGTGDLLINSNGNSIKLRTNNTENALEAVSNGGVFLFYDGLEKLATTSIGVGVTGTADVETSVLVGGADSIFAENNLRFKSGGSAFIDHNTVGQSIIFRTSVSSSLDTTPLTLLGSNANFSGDLTTSKTFKSTGSSTSTNINASASFGVSLKNTSDTDGNFAPIDFFNSTGFVTARIGAQFTDAGDRDTSLFFATRANGGGLATRLTINKTGNVGIGSTLEHIADAKLGVESATGNVGFNYGTSSSPERGNLWYDTDGTGWKFNIGKVQSSSFIPQVTIQDNGNVGVGITAPTFKLHVDSADASDNVAFIHHNNAAQSSGDVLKVRSDAGDNAGSALLNVQNNSGTALYVRGDRNIGIGTTAPGTLHGAAYGTTRLQIDGGTDRGQMIIEGDTDASIVMSDNGATANQRVFATNVGGEKYTIKPLNDNGTSTAGGVALTVLHAGEVGIGKTAPNTKLDVLGSIASGTTTAAAQLIYNSGGNITGFTHNFQAAKNTAAGIATNKTFVDISGIGNFHQSYFYVQYGCRLQGVTDSATGVVVRTYGLNRFNGGTLQLTETNAIAGSSNALTHSLVTVEIVSDTQYRIRVEFSSTVGGATFAAGEIKGYGVGADFPTITFAEGGNGGI